MSEPNACRSNRHSGHLLAFFAATLLSAGALLAGLLLTETGLTLAARALTWASDGMVRLDGVSGRLFGPFGIARLEIVSGNDRHTAEDLHLTWQPQALLEGRVVIDALHLGALTLAPGARTAPPHLPPTLRLPLAFDLASMRIDRLVLVDAEGPRLLAEKISATLTSDGRLHRLSALSLRSKQGELTATAELDGEAPHLLQARAVLNLDEPGTADTQARDKLIIAIDADGRLDALSLRADSRSPRWPLQAQAQLHPFSARVLSALSIEARDFDPRLLVPQVPRARLNVTASLVATSDAALAGDVRLVNSLPAPFDHEGLPVRHAEAKLTLDWQAAARRLRLTQLALAAPAGTATGEIDLLWPAAAPLPHGRAAIVLRGIDPAALHGKLPKAHVDGRIDFEGDASAQRGSLALRAANRQLQARLSQRDGWLHLAHLQIVQAAASLEAHGRVALAGGHDWQLAGRLQRFDPAAWHNRWPQGDLNGHFTTEGHLKPQPGGRLALQLAASRLAGQPLSGQLTLDVSRLGEWADLSGGLRSDRPRLDGKHDLSFAPGRLLAEAALGTAQKALQLDATHTGQL